MPRPTSDRCATERKHPWPKVRLGDVCEDKIQRIKSISEPRIAYIDIASIDNVQKRVIGVKEHDVDDAPGRAQQVVISGDVLVSNVRPNLNAVAIVDVVSAIPIVASTGFCVLRVKDIALPEYVYYYAQTSDFIDPLVAVSEKASYPSVTDTIVKDSLMPLPPLSVQREIVARLERELAAVEKMKKGFEALAETARAEFKAELKEVFEEISRRGAETRRLGEICEFENGDRGSNYPAKSKLLPNGEIPFISAINIANRSIREDNLLYLSQLHNEKLRAGKLQKGDIALCIRGSLGKFCIYSYERGAIASSLVILRCKELLSVGFLANFLESDLFFKQVAENGTGTAQPNLAAKNVMSFEIPLPSLAVQREVVARLDSAKARADKLEAKAREGVAACVTMRKAILKEAFE